MSLISQGSILEDRYLTNAELLARGASGLLLGTQGYGSTYGAGDNSSVLRFSPVPTCNAAKCFNWKSVSKGFNTTGAVKSDGTMWTWGEGCNFTLGLNLASTVNKCTPVQVGAGTDWRQISIGLEAASAVKRDGTLWGWGCSTLVGDNTTLNRCSPVQICSTRRFRCTIQNNGSPQYAYALSEQGQWWAWGYNAEGQLGVGYTFGQGGISAVEITPILLHTCSGWNFLCPGGGVTYAIDKNGAAWWWGCAGVNTLPYNSASTTVPERVCFGVGHPANDYKWKMMVSDSFATFGMGITQDDKLYGWGDNTYGQLGIGSYTVGHVDITQVDTTCDWDCLAIGIWQVVASKKDGSLWAWGCDCTRLGIGEWSGNAPNPVAVYTSAFNGWKSLTFGWTTGYSAIALL